MTDVAVPAPEFAPLPSVEPADDAQTDASPRERDLLQLKSLEQSLVRAHLAQPGPMLAAEFHRLRYALGLAALDRFVPGAALGAAAGADIEIDQRLLAGLRNALLTRLQPLLHAEADAGTRLCDAALLLRELLPLIVDTRARLIARHEADFPPEALDAEISRKQLVLVAGGGGGAGFVYIGALARLQQAGLVPAYIVGSSIGALLGAFVAQKRVADYAALLAFSKGLDAGGLFGPPRLQPPHGLPGLLRLHLGGLVDHFRNADGSPQQIRDLEIPYEAVVGGIRARVYDRIPQMLRSGRPKGRRQSLADVFAERMWQLTTLVTPNLIDEVVLGRDETTRRCEVIEAMGFSAAIPGVLQFEPLSRSADMEALLGRLREERQLAAIVDGGIANNVPAKPAWRGVRSGRIGTRNAFYLAFDCFRPQVDPRHLWLWPVTQAIQLQMPANRPYFDWLLQFQPTLSPINLLPSGAELDRAFAWGQQQVEAILPMLEKALEPIPAAALPWSR